MNDKIEYKGHLIEARPKQLLESEDWNDDGFIEIHRGGSVETTAINTDRTHATRDLAVSACHEFGKRLIDQSPLA